MLDIVYDRVVNASVGLGTWLHTKTPEGVLYFLFDDLPSKVSKSFVGFGHFVGVDFFGD